MSVIERLLGYINNTVTAASEDDVDQLLLLMSPKDDKEEMGELYSNVLGYNPITHYDRQFIERKFDEMFDIAPVSFHESLVSNRENIINRVMGAKMILDDDYMHYLLALEIANDTGWSDPLVRPDLLYIIHEELDADAGFELDNDVEILDDEDESDDEKNIDDDEDYTDYKMLDD